MNWIMSNLPTWNSWLAFGLYWLPLALCAYGYTLRAGCRFSKDRAARAKADTEERGYYSPTITIGTLIGYAVLSVMPIANLVAAIFDVAPKLFASMFEWFGKALDIPLVPKRNK
jgi:hypothetical protein